MTTSPRRNERLRKLLGGQVAQGRSVAIGLDEAMLQHHPSPPAVAGGHDRHRRVGLVGDGRRLPRAQPDGITFGVHRAIGQQYPVAAAIGGNDGRPDLHLADFGIALASGAREGRRIAEGQHSAVGQDQPDPCRWRRALVRSRPLRSGRGWCRCPRSGRPQRRTHLPATMPSNSHGRPRSALQT